MPNGMVVESQTDVNGRNTGKLLKSESSKVYSENIYYRAWATTGQTSGIRLLPKRLVHCGQYFDYRLGGNILSMSPE